MYWTLNLSCTKMGVLFWNDYYWYIFYSSTSYFGMRKDTPVLEVELDVDEMAKSHKAWAFVPGSTNYFTLCIH